LQNRRWRSRHAEIFQAYSCVSIISTAQLTRASWHFWYHSTLARFDTTDYIILLKRLNCSFGITCTVYSWLQSYLTGRTQSVKISIHSSPVTTSTVGVPQGSVFRPLLFSIYISTISTIAQSHRVCQQQYADDTQLFLALSPAKHTQSISVLQSCLNYLHIWFCENGMVLNPNKLVAILFGSNLCPGSNLLM